MTASTESPIHALADGLTLTLSQAMTFARKASGDMFLSAKGQRQGAITGESIAPGFEGQMHVTGWRWGLIAPGALQGVHTGAVAGKALTVFRNMDVASTKLMNALHRNEQLDEVKLTIRRSGDDQTEFMSITLAKAMVAAFDVQALPDNTLLEQVSFQYLEITVSYSGQKRSGLNKGAALYNGNFDANL